jgi:hypothetical protein
VNAPRPSTVVGIVASAFAATLLLLASGIAAPAQVTYGATEQGGGADAGATVLTYWTWAATQIWGMPAPLPTAASNKVAAPTVLPAAGTSYRTGPATSGNTSVRWEFSETTAAPGGKEIELRFTVGLSAASVSFRLYIETQGAPPTTAQTYYFYWDASTFAPARLTVETMQVTALACTAIGVCP